MPELPDEPGLSIRTSLTLADEHAADIQDLITALKSNGALGPEDLDRLNAIQRHSADIRGYLTEVELAVEDHEPELLDA